MWMECNYYHIKMRYSIEPRERRHVKRYGFLSFARNIGTIRMQLTLLKT